MLVCKSNSGQHIYAHDSMVAFLIKKLRKFEARLVMAANRNRYQDLGVDTTVKADIELRDHG